MQITKESIISCQSISLYVRCQMSDQFLMGPGIVLFSKVFAFMAQNKRWLFSKQWAVYFSNKRFQGCAEGHKDILVSVGRHSDVDCPHFCKRLFCNLDRTILLLNSFCELLKLPSRLEDRFLPFWNIPWRKIPCLGILVGIAFFLT